MLLSSNRGAIAPQKGSPTMPTPPLVAAIRNDICHYIADTVTAAPGHSLTHMPAAITGVAQALNHLLDAYTHLTASLSHTSPAEVQAVRDAVADMIRNHRSKLDLPAQPCSGGFSSGFSSGFPTIPEDIKNDPHTN